ARYSLTYYGQLALAKLGRHNPTLPPEPDDERSRQVFNAGETAQAMRTLLEADAAALAAPLAIDLARNLKDQGALEALGDLMQQYGQPRLSVIVGKLALQRGFALARHAFPTQGIPDFEPLEGSAE